jgi:predicted phage-related endonuclease
MSKFETLCNEYRENKRMIEELQAMNDSIKGDIIALMGDNETMIEGASKATNKTVVSSRFDSKALAKDKPDIYAAYSSKTEYKRFTVA